MATRDEIVSKNASVPELTARMGDADPGVAFNAYRQLEFMVMAASASETSAEADALAAALATELNARKPPQTDDKGKEKPGDLKYSKDARNHLLQLISYVAGEAQAAAVAGCIGDLDLRDMARYALERIPGPQASQALIAALDKEVGPTFRVGIINSLARRGCQLSHQAIKRATGDANKPVRIAAVEALAWFPDISGDAYMVKMSKDECKDCRRRANIARVRLAGTLNKAGKEAEARKLYKRIASSDACEAQKEAAQMALK
jgi:HEAT repeat protein